MIEALPKRAFFRFEVAVRARAFSKFTAEARKWEVRHMLPPLIEVEERPPLADVYAGWDAEGMQFLFDVPGRTTPFACQPDTWWHGDGVRICIDTRDARDVRRQTRYCHFFYILPTGGGSQRRSPIVGTHRMSHARETPPPCDTTLIDVQVDARRRGYALAVRIPASCLHGWDPQEHRRIGLFYKLNDMQLGAQTLSATDEMGWNQDPSTWATAVLSD
ncbi:MAG: hypothetical protein HRU75_12755 [Planctomycetia bacterium]|nr:MAG: hypothetical protein HRU75_12755 [Planctomycetia bacterium]